MRDRLDQLFQHCADLHLDVHWADLGGRRHGEYRPHDALIVLDKRLTRRQTIACLGHELGHVRFGDTHSSPPVERRAWEYAGWLLIRPEHYWRAEAAVGPHPGALAVELEVTTKVIEGFRRLCDRRGLQLQRGPRERPRHRFRGGDV